MNNHTPISTLNTFSRYYKLSHISMFRAILSPNLIPVSLDSPILNPQPQILLLFCTPLFFFVHSQPQVGVPSISNSATLSIFSLTCWRHLVPQLHDQQNIPCSLWWRTFDTIWRVIRCATSIISGDTYFHCFHKRLVQCGKVFKWPFIWGRRQNISGNKNPFWQLVNPIRHK